jgi:hypothetical protein
MNLKSRLELATAIDKSAASVPRNRHPIRSLVILAVIPVTFFLVTLQLTRVSGPEWLGGNFENSYVYLLNSLLLVKGKVPNHVDHPGTTTQMFGAGCLLLSGHGSKRALIKSVIENPESFLRMIHRTLLVFVAAGIWICPWLLALRLDGDWLLALLLQIPTLLFATIFYASIWFGSDLFQILPCIAGLTIWVFLIKQRETGALSFKACILAGLVCGLGIATKLTFFPIILLAVYCCRGRKNLSWFALGFVIPAAAVLVLLRSRLGYVFQWISGLATHSGYYGTGEVGFARMDAYLPDIIGLIRTEPAVALIPLILTALTVIIALTAGRGKNRVRQLSPTALAVFVLQVISFLVIAKHAKPHYLIAVYLTTGLNLVLFYEAIRAAGSGLQSRIQAVIGSLLIATLSSRGLFIELPGLTRQLRSMRIDQLTAYKRARDTAKDGVRVDYYRSVSPEFALYFANGWAMNDFSPLLKQKYPKALFYNIFVGSFEGFGQWIDRSLVLEQHDRLYFFGNSGALEGAKYFRSPDLRELYRQGEYVLEEWTRK